MLLPVGLRGDFLHPPVAYTYCFTEDRMGRGELVVAVAGATGAVGREMLKTLEQRAFPAKTVKALASSRSAGTTVPFAGGELTVEEMTEKSFEGVDIALFSAGGSTSKQFAPFAVKSGCVVIDNSSAWRMDPKVPLVVPEVNPADVDWHKGIIANPNCSTIQMVVALKPLHDVGTIKRVIVSTYQAVSGTGQKAIAELEGQVRQLFNSQEADVKVYPHQIAFNCLPQIDVFTDGDYTFEEVKMIKETNKIMGDDSIRVTATTVRVPVFYGHSESVNIETVKKITAKEARPSCPRLPVSWFTTTRRRRCIPCRLWLPAKIRSLSGASAKTTPSTTACICGSWPTTSAKARRLTPCRSPNC